MLQRLSKNRSSVVFSWLASYMSILLIPIIISGIVYSQSVDIVQKQVIGINDAMIRQLQQMVDNQVQNMDKISLQIAVNANLANLLNAQKPGEMEMDFSYSEKIKQILQDFHVYTLSNTFLKDFFIYMHPSRLVLTPSGLFDSQEYYRLYIASEGSSYESWIAFLQEKYYNQYMKVTTKGIGGTEEESLLVMRTLPLQGGPGNGTMAIYVNQEELLKQVESVNWANQDMFFIVDKDNRVLFSTQGQKLPDSILPKRMEEPSGLFFEQVAGEKAAVSYTSSVAADWKYISVTPTSVFNERVEYIRKLTLICFLLCVLLGGVVAYWFTKKNYHPLRKLIGNISAHAEFRQEKRQNEYLYLSDVFSSAISGKQHSDRKLEQQAAAMRATFLTRLLKGRSGRVMPEEEVLQAYGIRFEGSHFAVVMFNIDDYSRLKVHGDDEENLRLACFIVANVAEELLIQEGCRSYAAEVDDLLVVLVNLDGGRLEGLQQSLEAGIENIQQIMSRKFQIYLTAAVSEVHQTMAGIHEGYNEALEAMEYKLIKGRGGIIRYSEIKQAQNLPGSYNYSLETERILTNSIKSGDYGQAEAVMNRIFEDNFAGGPISIAIAKCLMFDLVGTMIKTVNEISTVAEPIFLEQLNPVNRLLRCNTIEDMRGEMSAILSQVCFHVNERSKGASQLKQRDMLIGFIEGNYADSGLNLNMLAEHVELSPKYVSSFFKQLTGEGISSYINRVRLEEAKRLLQEGKLNIGEIAVQVGFTNANALIRAFNRSEGITPGQYRDMHKR